MKYYLFKNSSFNLLLQQFEALFLGLKACGTKDKPKLAMKFVPVLARQILFCMCNASAIFIGEDCIKETLEWFGSSLALGRFVLRKNFEILSL